MKRPNHKVEMGYEAPWSSKVANKKCVAYISNDDELDDFWLAYARYLEAQRKKLKKATGEVVISDIVFRNMSDGVQVGRLKIERL